MAKLTYLGKADPKTSRMYKRGYTVSLPLAKTAVEEKPSEKEKSPKKEGK
jgi:hypothetical protein